MVGCEGLISMFSASMAITKTSYNFTSLIELRKFFEGQNYHPLCDVTWDILNSFWG